MTERENKPKDSDPVETATVNGIEYPSWVIEDARWIAERSGSTLESAIESVLAIEKAISNAKHADEDEPVRAIFKDRKDD